MRRPHLTVTVTCHWTVVITCVLICCSHRGNCERNERSQPNTTPSQPDGFSHSQSYSITCPETDTNYPAAVNASLEYGGLFADLNKPFACDDTVVGWHFCYFPPLDRLPVYTVELSVLRYEPAINGILYEQVPGSVYTVRLSGTQLHDNPSSCMDIQVPEFSAQEGNFVAVYIEQVISSNFGVRGLRSGHILDIIGNTFDIDDELSSTSPQCQSSNPNTNRQLRFACISRSSGHQIQASVITNAAHFLPNPNVSTGVQTAAPDTIAPTTMEQTTTEQTTMEPTSDSPLLPRLPIITTSTLTQPQPPTTTSLSESQPLPTSTTTLADHTHSSSSSSTATSTTGLHISSTPMAQSPSTAGLAERAVLVVPLAAAGGCVVVVLLTAVIVTLVVVVAVVQRRKAKLDMLKWRKERRHIGMDHFVIASEFPSSMGDAPQTPLPYEEPEPSISQRSRDSGAMVHENPNYSDSLPPSKPESYVMNLEHGRNEAHYYSDVKQVVGEQGEVYGALEDACESPPLGEQGDVMYEAIEDACESESPLPHSKAMYASVDKGRQRTVSEVSHKPLPYEEPVPSPTLRTEEYSTLEDACESLPPHIQALYAIVDKGKKRKPSIAPPIQASKLYEHYYKTLEEVSSGKRRPSSTEEKFRSPASSERDLLAQFEQAKFVQIPSKEIKIMSHLGAGQFGSVSKGAWKRNKQTVDVAVKSIMGSKAEDKAMNRVKLLQEAIIMGQFHNPNVIHFYGMVISKDTVTLVMELATKGDLEHLLDSMLPDPGEIVPPDTDIVMLGFCQQVAFGMFYLSSKGFVHRDLAARNILVTQDNVLKIADFGMSRDLANENYYVSQGGKIPVKWTAPEAVNYLKYSTASDVWSYGCLLYEIWSLGQIPFRDYSNTEALAKLSTGYRLTPPPGCPRLIYDIMIRCWNPEPQQRTPFKTLIYELLEPETKVLYIPNEAIVSHQLAGNIGGPLEAGECMYLDLQSRYNY